MNEKNKKFNWLKSIAINLVIMVVAILFTHMVYETNDDYVIASRIADGYPEVYFINYYLCEALIKLQPLMASYNAFVVAQIAMSFISFVCILKLIMDKSDNSKIVIMAVAVIALFSIDHYCTIQFSKTAAVITVAGSMLIMDALTEKRNFLYYLFGVLFMLIGAGLRIEGVVVPLGFAAIYGVKWMIENRDGLGGKLKAMSPALIIVLVAVIGGSGLLFFANYRANSCTQELAEYVEYNDLRTRVIDYSVLDYYDDQKAEYDKAGLSAGDVKLIKAWVFDYDGAASKENLQKILDIGKGSNSSDMTPKKATRRFVKTSIKDVKGLQPTGVHIIVLAMLGLWMLLFAKPSGKLFVILVVLATAVLHIALIFIERPAYRALYVPDVCAAVYLLYAAADLKDLGRVKSAPTILIAVLSLLLILPIYKDANKTYQSNSKRIMSEEMAEFLDSNKDNFYVIATREKKSNASYLTPLKVPDTKSESNFMGTGSWGTKSPYLFEKMEPYGIKNPIKDLIDNDKAYYMGNKNIEVLTDYYNKWYVTGTKKIRLEQVGEVSGIKLWSVKTK